MARDGPGVKPDHGHHNAIRGSLKNHVADGRAEALGIGQVLLVGERQEIRWPYERKQTLLRLDI